MTRVTSLGLAFLLATSASAGEHDHHGQVGKVDFPVSCAPAVRADFERGVALLHSFAYARSRETFEQVAAADPTCAMAHWGVAMTLFHPVWAAANLSGAPTPDELARGSAAIEKARSLKADAREKDFIAATGAFYAGSGDYSSRALAFENAMADLHRRRPADQEATIFYALSLLGNAPPSDKTYARQKQAAALLEPVVAAAPEHPGIAHYIIHSFDYPALAELALPAARAYAKIAPAAPHALHMPSHIFTRLALWDESIGSNLASAASAHAGVKEPDMTAFDELHALDYLEYAYLQTCRDAKADEVAAQVARVTRVDDAQFAAAHSLAAVPARHALERRDWAAAQAVSLQPASFPWDRFTNAQVLVAFTRGLGAARTGHLPEARAAVAQIEELKARLEAKKDALWAGQAEVQRLTVNAWIAQAEKRPDEAVKLLTAAADAEDASEKHPVTPGHLLPAREQLADLLMVQSKPAEALAAYEASLKLAPGRFNSLDGAFRAAKAAGRGERARQHATALVGLCATGSRPAVDAAREFLAPGATD